MSATLEKPVKTEEQEIRELVARATKFYQRWESFGKQFETLWMEFRNVRADVVQLLNARESIDRKVKDSEIVLARNEKEAQQRLASVEMGHRALIDRLSKQEAELRNKNAEMERAELHMRGEREKIELLRASLEARIAAVTDVSKNIKK